MSNTDFYPVLHLPSLLSEQKENLKLCEITFVFKHKVAGVCVYSIPWHRASNEKTIFNAEKIKMAHSSS